jgi:ankyrin repeat protein
LRSLLERNASLNINSVHSTYGWTALHYAAREGRKDVAEVLVAGNADTAIYDPVGRTPKDVAKEMGYREVLSALR